MTESNNIQKNIEDLYPNSIGHNQPFLKTLGRILQHFLPHWGATVGLILLVLLSSLFATYPVLLIKKIVDTISDAESFETIIVLTACFGFIHILGVFTNRGMMFLSAYLQDKLAHETRCKMLNHLNTLSLKFYEKQSSGELLSKIIGDSEIAVKGFLQPALFLAQSSTRFIFIFCFMASIEWRLALLCVPAGIFASLLVRITGRQLQQKQTSVRSLTDSLWAKISEILRGMRDIQANNQESRISDKITASSEDVRIASRNQHALDYTYQGLHELIFIFTITMVIGCSAYRVWSGLMTYGALAAFIAYTHFLIDPLANFASLCHELQKVIVSARRIFSILDETPQVYDRPNAEPIVDTVGELVFDDVCFDYGDGQDALKNMSFQIKPGEYVAIVGPSGGGKTTVVKLIARFYDPDNGRILLDGKDIREFRIRDLRYQLGIVFQEIFLFEGTLLDNIVFSKPEASKQQIEEVIKTASIDEFLPRLPDNIDTMVGENGLRLSGGQRQRIAIARALIRKPSILIFDEAGSELDSLTGAQVAMGIKNMGRNQTMIVIAHRLSTVTAADNILVIDKGCVVEQGTHSELINRKGLYHQMYKAQFASSADLDNWTDVIPDK